NPQTVTVASVGPGWTIEYLTSPTAPSSDFSELVTQYTSQSGKYRAILWGGDTWTIQTSALPSSPGYAVQPWVVEAKQRALNTNGAMLTVIAPLRGSGGLAKHGAGLVQLTSTNSLSGENMVTGGVLSSSAATAQPFGTGSIVLLGNGVLAFTPSGAATLASGPGGQLSVRSGGGTLALGGTASFVVTIGGNIQGATPNLHRLSGASLVVAVGGGLAALGTSQQVLIAGNHNRPPLYNGMILPWVVGQDSDAGGSGGFLSYDGTSGLMPATTVNSVDTPIDLATISTIYQVTDSQTVGSVGASVFALEMDGGSIDGTGTLHIGSQAAGGIAGLILNGGDISAPLQAGASETAIYAADNGITTLSGTLGGSGDVVVFGPGTVALAADNSTTLSGNVVVNAGTLIAAGSGSATGAGAVTVTSSATLHVTGVVGGPISVEQSGLLYLDGGTVADVTLASAGGVTSYQGGYLQGGGTITGQAIMSGVIQSGPAAGLLNFTGAASFSEDTSFYWRLDGLFDDSTPTSAPEWNSLQFANQPSVSSAVSVYFDFSALGGDPDQANASFWSKAHTWTVWNLPPGGTFWVQLEGWSFAAGVFGISNTFPYPLIWTPASPQVRAALLQQKAAQRLRQRRPWHWRLRNVPRGRPAPSR
ncbi:MAG TPA: hypothetical protein VEC60_10580, partial [Reyranella sp.]|nr:hypothetical protein [Reyranella sp.]